MKLYITAAGVYAGTQVEAKADGKGWRPEEVPTDKQGLIDYLNRFVHSDERDGLVADWMREDTPALGPNAEIVRTVDSLSYTKQSIQTDEDFDKLPVARQLDLAARAMENAREALPNPPSKTAKRMDGIERAQMESAFPPEDDLLS